MPSRARLIYRCLKLVTFLASGSRWCGLFGDAVLAIGERWTEASCPLNDCRKAAGESGICGLSGCLAFQAAAGLASAARLRC
jgi:hypothetical protein